MSGLCLWRAGVSTASDNTQTWMLCEDMLTRLKDELILEALDILHGEMEAGRIDIKGYSALLPDKSDEMQKDMYLINNLRLREAEIREQYALYLDGTREWDPEVMQRVEGLRKFVLSVNAISMLMKFSDISGEWAEDTGRFSREGDFKAVLIGSMKMSPDRVEVAEFAVSSRKFTDSGALSGSEMEALAQAIGSCRLR